MYTETTKVINKFGIHARPASNLTLKAKEFVSDITIKNLNKPDSKAINAKGIMMLLAAGIGTGSVVEITADGDDEQQAVKELVKLFDAGFSEE